MQEPHEEPEGYTRTRQEQEPEAEVLWEQPEELAVRESLEPEELEPESEQAASEEPEQAQGQRE